MATKKSKLEHTVNVMAGDSKVAELEMVTIPKSQYDSLLRRARLLAALKGAGVDNWNGYDHAMETLRQDGYFDEDD